MGRRSKAVKLVGGVRGGLALLDDDERRRVIEAGERDIDDGVGFFRGTARPDTALMVAYIDEFKDRFRGGPICRVLAASLDCGFITPRGGGAEPAARGRHHLRAHGQRLVRLHGVRRRRVRPQDRRMGVHHHHGHRGAAAAGAGTGDVMGRLAWRHGRSRAPFRPWRAVHRPRVHHQGRGVRHASLGRHGRRLVRQRHGRERRRRVFEGPGIGDVPVGLVVELEASAPVLGLRDTGTDRNRVLCKPSGASRPTIRAEQKSGHII